MKQKVLYILLGFSLGLNVSLVGAMAYWVTRPEKGFVHQRWERSMARLPANVRQKLDEARREDQPEFERIHKEMAETRQDLLAALAAETPDTTRIDGDMARITELQKRIQTMIVARILTVSKLLSPEERQAYFKVLRRSFGGPRRGLGSWSHEGPPPGPGQGTAP
jgi:uncharacterized membrane protein